MYHILFIHSNVSGHLVVPTGLAIVKNTAVNVKVQISVQAPLLGISPEVELLDEVVILCLIF